MSDCVENLKKLELYISLINPFEYMEFLRIINLWPLALYSMEAYVYILVNINCYESLTIYKLILKISSCEISVIDNGYIRSRYYINM